MLIDWFTVVAQALNFLILIWLLKRFLYKPVLDAIDSRERHIELELNGAAAKQAEALLERDALRNKNAAFDAQRADLLAAATDQGAAERARLLAAARREADDLRAQYADMARADEARLVRQIARLAQEEVFGMARKALADLCDAQLESRMGTVFLRRLRSLDPETKNLLGAALRNSTDAAVLRRPWSEACACSWPSIRAPSPPHPQVVHMAGLLSAGARAWGVLQKLGAMGIP